MVEQPAAAGKSRRHAQCIGSTYNRATMIPSKRLPYSAIIDRAPLKLPRGIRMIVWPIVNVEVWDIGRPMPRQALPPPTGVTRLPDVPHWAWHEYGNRVGFWRMKAVLDRLKITPSLSINARVCLDYPRIASAARAAGWEFMGHSYDQRPIHLEPNQRATIRKAVKVIRDYTGKQPVGWLGPGFTQTLDTPEHLAEAGIRYICDWPVDDEPVEIKTKKGPAVGAALQHRAQRYIHDDRAPSAGEGVLHPLHGLFRTALRGIQAHRQDHVDCGAPVHLRRPLPDQVLRTGTGNAAQEAGGGVLDRRADHELVPQNRGSRSRRR